MILDSGGTVHNLREIQWTATRPAPWVAEFDEWIFSALGHWDTENLFRYDERAPHAKRAVPRPEHLAPLFLSMGAADSGRNAVRLACEYEFGSLSLSAFAFS